MQFSSRFNKKLSVQNVYKKQKKVTHLLLDLMSHLGPIHMRVQLLPSCPRSIKMYSSFGCFVIYPFCEYPPFLSICPFQLLLFFNYFLYTIHTQFCLCAKIIFFYALTWGTSLKTLKISFQSLEAHILLCGNQIPFLVPFQMPLPNSGHILVLPTYY